MSIKLINHSIYSLVRSDERSERWMNSKASLLSRGGLRIRYVGLDDDRLQDNYEDSYVELFASLGGWGRRQGGREIMEL